MYAWTNIVTRAAVLLCSGATGFVFDGITLLSWNTVVAQGTRSPTAALLVASAGVRRTSLFLCGRRLAT